jgi:hypothetical protein
MPIHHVTYAMPNARNAQMKAIHMLQRSSHTPTQEIKHTPSSPRKLVKVAWSRGLVKISASWSCVGTWIKAIFPFSTLSLRKWSLTSMYLVLEWSTGFFAMLMARALKWDMGILLTKVTHGVCDSKELRATTSCDNVLCLGSGFSNMLTRNVHLAPSTQQAEQAGFTRAELTRRASQFSLKINKRQSS